MVDIGIEVKHISRLERVFGDSPRVLRIQTKIALNSIAKKHKTTLTKTTTSPIAKRVAISSTGLKRAIKVTSEASERNLRANIRIKKEFRPSLKEFGGRATNKGVGYRISKSGGRQFIEGAFPVRLQRKDGSFTTHFFKRKHPYIHTTNRRRVKSGKKKGQYKEDKNFVGPRPQGNADLRRRNRMMTQKLRGPSVWGVYEFNDLKTSFSIPDLRRQLPKAIKERIKAGIYGIRR